MNPRILGKKRRKKATARTNKALIRLGRKYLFDKQDGKCAGCGLPFKLDVLTIDHIRALAAGGGCREHNLQLLCKPCNRLKGRFTMEHFRGILRDRAAALSKAAS